VVALQRSIRIKKKLTTLPLADFDVLKTIFYSTSKTARVFCLSEKLLSDTNSKGFAIRQFGTKSYLLILSIKNSQIVHVED
jgi:hypothetical protein